MRIVIFRIFPLGGIKVKGEKGEYDYQGYLSTDVNDIYIRYYLFN